MRDVAEQSSSKSSILTFSQPQTPEFDPVSSETLPSMTRLKWHTARVMSRRVTSPRIRFRHDFECSAIYPNRSHRDPGLSPVISPRRRNSTPFQMQHMPSTPHATRLMSYVSRLGPHVSRLTSHISRLTSHVSRLTPAVSRLTSYVSRLGHQNLTFNVSRIAAHVSRLMSHV